MVKTKEEQSKELRSRIQKSIDNAREEQKKELFKKRVELARVGVDQKGNIKSSESVGAFESYLRILEEMKKVKEGGLTPSHFDKKLDVHELLLISGIYWDLTKVYDHTKKSKEQMRRLVLCLDKYVIFSKKMPYEVVCAETLRKYIQNGKAVHEELFKKSYKKLTDGQCFVATALSSQMPVETLPVLRIYRDTVLLESFCGISFVKIYYLLGPALVILIQKLPRRTQLWMAKFVSGLAKSIQARYRFELDEK